MSITVPENVKPSGGLVVPSLSGIPAQSTVPPAETLPNRPLRLVPALVGPGAQQQRIYIECPEWCTVDHVKEHVGAIEDLTHYGDTHSADIVTMLDDDTLHSSLMAGLSLDPSAADPRLRRTHILLNNENNPEEARLTPDMADELADDLVSLADFLRGLARTAREFNAAEAQA
jgi:hypothetical protein